MIITNLPYYPDSSVIFSKFIDLPWPIFLDSCQPFSDQGRFDIISAQPAVKLITQGHVTHIQQGTTTRTSTGDPFTLIKEHLIPKQAPFTLPFQGGAMGYFAYDLGARLHGLKHKTTSDISLPDMAIGLYDWCIVVDHQEQRSTLVNHQQSTTHDSIMQRLDKPTQTWHYTSNHNHTLHSNFTRASYDTAFNTILNHIYHGDCYQINLAQRFSLAYPFANSWPLYCHLRQVNPAPFSAYFQLEQSAVLSFSPERFIQVQSGHAQTKPIKGTRARGRNEKDDHAQIQALKKSTKDQAENLMIVDLMRNDFGRCCQFGSVKVEKLFAIESYPSVHHLVSTVEGQLNTDKHSMDLLRCCFPGGSITGAPKRRAMEIIARLEPHVRSVYCGSLGYINHNGDMDSNIAIRTMVHDHNTLHLWAGGGIVHESTAASEYQETFDKVAILLHELSQ